MVLSVVGGKKHVFFMFSPFGKKRKKIKGGNNHEIGNNSFYDVKNHWKMCLLHMGLCVSNSNFFYFSID